MPTTVVSSMVFVPQFRYGSRVEPEEELKWEAGGDASGRAFLLVCLWLRP